MGSYDGALLIVATLNVLSGVLIFFAPPPKKSSKHRLNEIIAVE